MFLYSFFCKYYTIDDKLQDVIALYIYIWNNKYYDIQHQKINISWNECVGASVSPLFKI